MYKILKNKIIDHFRKASTRNEERLEDDFFYFDESGHWTSNGPKDWNINYNDTIATKEFFEVFEKYKKKLKEIQSMVFSMKYLDGFESEEICKELNITPSNYWVLLHRAKLQLRNCLEKNWFIK